MEHKIAALFLSALAATAVTGAASGATPADAAGPGITVRYSPADLDTAKGTEILYARLKRAAKQVCPGTDELDLMRAVPARACYEAALAGAVERVRQPRLTALHAQREGGRIPG